MLLSFFFFTVMSARHSDIYMRKMQFDNAGLLLTRWWYLLAMASGHVVGQHAATAVFWGLKICSRGKVLVRILLCAVMLDCF